MKPFHIAIIMDGNGRWAKLKGRERTFGHVKGARVAKNIIEHCSKIGVSHLTLYAFSTENWLRPLSEVALLMRLLAKNLKRERIKLIKNNIKFQCIGDFTRIPSAVVSEIRQSIEQTEHNTGMTLTFALSYGGRQEITCAAKAIAQKVMDGQLKIEDINESTFAHHLQTSSMPDPDLMVRTSGEFRLSNFLTWQSAYSEIFISNTLWPEFTCTEMNHAIEFFRTRQRRFGKTQEQQDQFKTHPTQPPLSKHQSASSRARA